MSKVTAATPSSDTSPLPTPAELDRYIDRFMRARGWRVTDVQLNAATSIYDVTLSDSDDPSVQRSVVRRASSAGEATFKACSAVRLLEESASHTTPS